MNGFLPGLVACVLLAKPGLAADGDLDKTFGTGGKVVTGFELPAAHANAIALQPDGKIVAAGWLFNLTGILGFAVARYNPDGSLDPTFGLDGRVGTAFFGGNDTAAAAVVQPDGKILVAGTVGAALQLHFAVVRYLPDGTLDPTFDGDGKAIGSFFGSVGAMVLQPDGKIVVAGGSDQAGTNGDIALSRYNPDGSLDSTFGTGGTAHTDIAGLAEGASALLLLPGGKLLAVGSTETNVTVTDIALVRYNADGSLDSTFGDGGKATIDIAGHGDDAFDAALQPDGKIVVSAGIFNPAEMGGNFSVIRFLASGDLDPAFGSKGRAVVAFPGDARASGVALQSDGKIVAAGLAFGPTLYDFALVRFNPDGSPDASFGPSGAVVVTDFFGRGDGASAVLVQPDGRILAGGSAIDETTGYMALARYLGTPASPAPPTCPRSHGYWRSHPEEWAVASLVLGAQTYAAAELLALLRSPVKGDASEILARQLIAAKLNLAAGAGSNELAAEVAAADALFAGFAGRLPYGVSPSSSSGRAMIELAGRLAARNNRGSSPECGEAGPFK